MATSFIGSFEFVTLHHPQDRGAPPLLTAEQTDIIQRPGVDGTAIMLMGVKGESFQMRSFVNVPTFALANDLMALYRDLIGEAPQTVVWNGVDYEIAYQVKYAVLDVKPISLRAVSVVSGGLSGGTGAVVDALWTLQPIDVSQL